MATVEERVKAITARVLKVKPDQIKAEHSFTVDLGASSVQSIELVATFEEEFGIEMEEDAALSVENVGKAVEFITDVCKQQGVDVDWKKRCSALTNENIVPEKINNSPRS